MKYFLGSFCNSEFHGLAVTCESMCTEYWLTALSLSLHRKSVVRLTDHLTMTVAVLT